MGDATVLVDGVVPMPFLYSGGESSRIYPGRWYVRSWFLWPDGQHGVHDTDYMPYEDAMAWVAAAAFVPVVVVDAGREHAVQVTSAVIRR